MKSNPKVIHWSSGTIKNVIHFLYDIWRWYMHILSIYPKPGFSTRKSIFGYSCPSLMGLSRYAISRMRSPFVGRSVWLLRLKFFNGLLAGHHSIFCFLLQVILINHTQVLFLKVEEEHLRLLLCSLIWHLIRSSFFGLWCWNIYL